MIGDGRNKQNAIYVIHNGRNGGTVHWTLRFVRLETFQSIGVEQLGRVVLGRRDEQRLILRHLHVVDGFPVLGNQVQLLPRPGNAILFRFKKLSNLRRKAILPEIPLRQITVLVPRDDHFVIGSPQHGRGFGCS